METFLIELNNMFTDMYLYTELSVRPTVGLTRAEALLYGTCLSQEGLISKVKEVAVGIKNKLVEGFRRIKQGLVNFKNKIFGSKMTGGQWAMVTALLALAVGAGWFILRNKSGKSGLVNTKKVFEQKAQAIREHAHVSPNDAKIPLPSDQASKLKTSLNEMEKQTDLATKLAERLKENEINLQNSINSLGDAEKCKAMQEIASKCDSEINKMMKSPWSYDQKNAGKLKEVVNGERMKKLKEEYNRVVSELRPNKTTLEYCTTLMNKDPNNPSFIETAIKAVKQEHARIEQKKVEEAKSRTQQQQSQPQKQEKKEHMWTAVVTGIIPGSLFYSIYGGAAWAQDVLKVIAQGKAVRTSDYDRAKSAFMRIVELARYRQRQNGSNKENSAPRSVDGYNADKKNHQIYVTLECQVPFKSVHISDLDSVKKWLSEHPKEYVRKSDCFDLTEAGIDESSAVRAMNNM